MRLGALFFRRVHKWIGLILGLQFLLWATSGAMMATLDMKSVGGCEEARDAVAPALPTTGTAWPEVQRALTTVPTRIESAPVAVEMLVGSRSRQPRPRGTPS